MTNCQRLLGNQRNFAHGSVSRQDDVAGTWQIVDRLTAIVHLLASC